MFSPIFVPNVSHIIYSKVAQKTASTYVLPCAVSCCVVIKVAIFRTNCAILTSYIRAYPRTYLGPRFWYVLKHLEKTRDETWSEVMWSSFKRNSGTWLGQWYISLEHDITKFNTVTVFLHSNWSSLRRKYWSKIPTDVYVLSCGLLWAKITKHFVDFGRHLPLATYAKILAACTRACHSWWRNLF